MPIISVRPRQNTSDAFMGFILGDHQTRLVAAAPAARRTVVPAPQDNISLFWRRERITVEMLRIVKGAGKIDFRSVAPGASAFSVLLSTHADIDPVSSGWAGYRPESSALPLFRQFAPLFPVQANIRGLFFSPLGTLKISVKTLPDSIDFIKNAVELFGAFFSIGEVRLRIEG